MVLRMLERADRALEERMYAGPKPKIPGFDVGRNLFPDVYSVANSEVEGLSLTLHVYPVANHIVSKDRRMRGIAVRNQRVDVDASYDPSLIPLEIAESLAEKYARKADNDSTVLLESVRGVWMEDPISIITAYTGSVFLDEKGIMITFR